jgi:two-component system, sensor histidine kinase PdtaS
MGDSMSRIRPELALEIVESVPVIVLVLTVDGCIEYVNPYFESLTGRSLSEVQGKDWFSTFLPERDHERIKSLFAQSLVAHELHGNVNPIVTRSGEEREIEWHVRTLYDESGKPKGNVSFGKDVTEERKLARAQQKAEEQSAQEQLREQELSRSILDAFPGFAALYANDGQFLMANKLTIQSSPRATGSKVVPWELPGVAQRTSNLDKIRRAMAQAALGKSERFDSTIDGNDIEVHCCPVLSEQGVVFNIAMFGIDVSERNKALRALARSEAQLRHAQNLAHLGSWERDIQTGNSYWSDEVYRILGLDPEHTTPSYERFLECVHPEDLQYVNDALAQPKRNQNNFEIRYRVILPGGKIKHLHARGSFEQEGTDGLSGRVWGTVLDISEQVSVEQRLRKILDNMFTYVGLFELNGVCVEVNQAPLEVANLTRGEVIGLPFWETYWWSHSKQMQEKIRNALQKAAKGEVTRDDYQIRVAENSFQMLDIKCGPMRDEDGRIEGIIASGVDISDRKRAETEAHKTSALLRTIVRGAPVVLFAMEANGIITLSEGHGMSKLGIGPGQSIGLSALDLYRSVPVFGTCFQRALAGETVKMENEFKGIYFETQLEPRVGQDGRIDGVIGLAIDVTEKVHQQQKIAAQLAEKEVLLREIHHRVKNNLQIISSLLYFQAKKASTPTDAAAFAEGRERLFSMILVHEHLYKSQDLSRVDLGDYLQALVSALLSSFPERTREQIKVKCTFDKVKLPIESALPSGMIVAELVTNALKYAFPEEQCGTVAIQVRSREGRVELEVFDNGVGFSAGFDSENISSFGWQLIRNLVMQLDGELHVSQRPGVWVQVSFPQPDEIHSPSIMPN